MGEPNIIENFYGVYLLYCLNPKYLGRTYIGYTVDPNRRIKQHNKGAHAGGARRTSKRGPWTMVMIIHGFPNDIAALRFEWAWQHPTISRRLKQIPKKRAREKVFDYCLRVLSEMLRVGPWNRLPLTVRWLDEKFKKDFPMEQLPPMHMPIIEGNVISKKVVSITNSQASFNEAQMVETIDFCDICKEIIVGNKLKCISNHCKLKSHVICLSKLFLKPGEYIPIYGDCPKCGGNYLWGDFVRKFKGCYQNVSLEINTSVINEDLYGSDEDCN